MLLLVSATCGAHTPCGDSHQTSCLHTLERLHQGSVCLSSLLAAAPSLAPSGTEEAQVGLRPAHVIAALANGKAGSEMSAVVFKALIPPLTGHRQTLPCWPHGWGVRDAGKAEVGGWRAAMANSWPADFWVIYPEAYWPTSTEWPSLDS